MPPLRIRHKEQTRSGALVGKYATHPSIMSHKYKASISDALALSVNYRRV